jgi:hypothetical protein
MLELAMPRPWPKATHSWLLGAEIWKKMSPEPDDAVFSGMFNLKQIPVDGHTLPTWAEARDAKVH